MARRKKQGLARLWQLVTLLDVGSTGCTASQLTTRLGVSRATLYRYLSDLEQAEVGVEKSVVTGEVRYRLRGAGIPRVVPTARQLAALHLAREALGALEGTAILEQVDTLLRRWGGLSRDLLPVTRRGRPAERRQAEVLRHLDQALSTRRRVALEYCGVKDSAAYSRHVDPVALRVDHDVVYLLAYDHGRADYRVFKTARILAAEVLPEPALDHSALDVRDAFSRSVKAWSGGPTESVVVRLSAAVARFADEYRLMADQTVESLGDGSVLVRAEVAGVTEAMRWVLSWGAQAEAIAPRALREAVRREVEGAAARYAGGPKVRGGKQAVSPKMRGVGGTVVGEGAR